MLASTDHRLLVGHDDAYFDANILHRDISTGNILIAKDQSRYRGENAAPDEEVDSVKMGSGLLTDWDSCVDVKATDPLQIGRAVCCSRSPSMYNFTY